MILSNKKPAVYEKCKELFGVDWDRGVIITYGDTVHCKYMLPPDLIAHESVHVKQQTEMGKDAWWSKYFVDKEFRLSQEVEAYQCQLKYARDNYDRTRRRRVQKQIYKDMASVYGEMCTEEGAKVLVP